MKKSISLILLIMLAFITNNLFAQWSGLGTQANPYLIYNTTDLKALSTYVNVGSTTTNKYFKLMSDIDMINVQNFVPIGGWDTSGSFVNSSIQFKGNFDGNGKIISNLSILKDTSNNSSIDRVGLFGYVGIGAIIKNLGLVNASIRGSLCVGILCGYGNNATISNCFSTGSVSGWDACGGLIGFIEYCTINTSYSKANVNGSNYIGGFIGHNSHSNTINNYAVGNVTGITKVCGFAYNNTSTNSNNYFRNGCIINGTGGLESGTSINDSIMKSIYFLTLINNGLDSSSFKKDPLNYFNNGYPLLVWQNNLGVAMEYVTNITNNSAILHATIINNNVNFTSKGFYYKMDIDTIWSEITDIIADSNMVVNLVGLNPHTIYQFKGYISNQTDSIKGETLTFTTLHTPATITTDSASLITTTNATLNGILNRGSKTIIATGFKYKRVNATSYMCINVIDSDTLEADISGLLPNTEYTFKAYAITQDDTIQGENINFITLSNNSLNTENIYKANIILFPNPTSDYAKLIIEGVDKDMNMIIYDIRGKQIMNEILKPNNNSISTTINTSNLPKGLYSIKISNDKFCKTEKLIIR